MHEEKGHKPVPPAQQAPSNAGQDPLEAIMAAGELPKVKAGGGSPAKPGARDLAADALAAARAAEPAASASDTLAADLPATQRPAPAARREFWWRGLLLLNCAVLAVVLALPSAQPGPAVAPADVPSVKPRAERQLGFAINEQTFYLRALELAGQGKFDDAIAVLDGYLKANPDLVEVERRLILHAMAMFAVRVGRADDASRYEAAMDRLRVGAQLPQDLLDLAKQAEAEGRGADMRRYYARFLLQQKQVPPSLRARIAEAHLKLGDGYRLEAEQGAEREAAKLRAAESEAAGKLAPDPKAPDQKAPDQKATDQKAVDAEAGDHKSTDHKSTERKSTVKPDNARSDARRGHQ